MAKKSVKKTNEILVGLLLIVMIYAIIITVLFFNKNGLDFLKGKQASPTVVKEKIAYLAEENTACENLEIIFPQLEHKDSQTQVGDAIYIKAGDVDIVVDAGEKGVGTNVMVPLLEKYVTDKEIDLIITTHSDSDHMGGMVGVDGQGVLSISGFTYRNILDFGYLGTTYLFDEYYEIRQNLIENKSTKYYKVEDSVTDEETPNVFYLGMDTTLTILDTKMYDYITDVNEYSVCFLLEHGSQRFLFTGDAYDEAEKNLTNLNIGHVDFYKAAHHGSPTSNSVALLDTITPDYVVIDATYSNKHNLPKKEIVDRFTNYTVNIYAPFVNGTLHVLSDGLDISITCEGFYDYETNKIITKTKSLIKVQNSDWYKYDGVYTN